MAKGKIDSSQDKKKSAKKPPRYIQEESSKIEAVRDYSKMAMRKLDFDLTKKQNDLLKLLHENKITTITGPAGTSKTFIACYAAIQMLISGKCKKIILSKPTEVLSGTKDPGALPGSLDEKMAVYAESFFDIFSEILYKKDFAQLWADKVIEFKPAQFLRGRSLKEVFVICDEFQNFDIKALKSIVTRLGRGSTMSFAGDTRQNDINKKYVAVDAFIEILSPIKHCATFKFERNDIVREQILIDIVDRFEQFENEGKLPGTIRNS